ncbi:HD-GYP domain-containing protein [Paenibacillus sediminis]|uniref:Nucleotidyltransferase with HDIG domain n=1 Tax=Paenibacillus sediminis TaxID=664909 RepID=A0ABS4H6H4_9BACL|nr:HD-GYP domain-containing protein [Paenibacillus sediminis]MBP1937837.1 putative nucleotidyltransferase with HDIG domain [Paenibacillus sediminis]
MRAHVTEIKPGDVLQTDTFNEYGLHVLPKGTKLGQDDISKLFQFGIDYVDIEVRQTDITVQTPSSIAENVHKAKASIDQAMDGFEQLFLEALSTGKINESVVDDTLEPLVDQLVGQSDVVSLLLMVNDDDDYTYKHSMQVSMLSYYIAGWLGYSKEEAYAAGKAGYLHDIGKSLIPSEILKKPGKLTPEEFETMKLHTTYGYDIIMDSIGDERTALVALQHHEREDGTGYPKQLREGEIHPFAKITAVADVYSAMTSNRIYQSKRELLSVLQEMFELSFGNKLNATATQVFIQHMLPNFIGKKVVLTNGETGTIVMTNPADFFRPLIQTEQRFTDLSKERSIAIERVFI